MIWDLNEISQFDQKTRFLPSVPPALLKLRKIHTDVKLDSPFPQQLVTHLPTSSIYIHFIQHGLNSQERLES